MSGLLNKLTGHSSTSNTEHHDHDGHHHNKATTTTTQTTTSTSNPTYQSGLQQSGMNTTGQSINQSSAYGNTMGNTTTTDQAVRANNLDRSNLYTTHSGLTGDEAITRSEEQLHVAKARVETGKAELNKYVTTEHVEQAVPVQRERVVIEREPITGQNLGRALEGPDISEAHFETTLHEDKVAASKETVPIERIRLAKQTETSVESVGADLRKEHVDFTHTSLNDKVDNYGRTNNLSGDKIDNIGQSNMSGSTLSGNKVDNIGRNDLHSNALNNSGVATGYSTSNLNNSTARRDAY